MIRPLLKSLALTAVVGLFALGAGWAVIAHMTTDTRFINMPPPPEQTVGAVITEVLSGGAPTPQVDDGAWREAIRKRAADGLFRSVFQIAGIAILLAAAWQAYAWKRVGGIGTTSGSTAGAPLWTAGLLVTIAASAWTLWTAFNRQGPAALMAGKAVGGVIIFSLALGWLAYHLATALGAPLQMRGSVPLARLLPIGRARA